jgi:ornithine cyclodeaminase
VTESRIDFLYLSEEAVIEAGMKDMAACVDVMEETFTLVGEGDYIMGGPTGSEHGVHMFFPVEQKFPGMPVHGPDRRFMAMIAYLGGRFNITGEKWYGSNVENRKRNLPRSILVVMLNDTETGQPLALMSANILSAMRTGAVPGVAARYIAPQDSSLLGLVGAGVISTTCLMGFVEALPELDEVQVFDIDLDKARTFAAEKTEQLGISVRAVDSLEKAVRGADIVNIATSGVKKPVIEDEWLKPGAMLSLPAPAGVSEELLLSSRLVLDDIQMHEDWYEVDQQFPEGDPRGIKMVSGELFRMIDEGKLERERLLGLGDIVCGNVEINRTTAEPSVVIMGGMPVEDVAWGYHVYQQAKAQGIGQKLTLWEEPHWA